MQLSRLEIRGFKSFGDRVVIDFDNGVTGIVGPNGCGKSNVVDAIRWVLGEQKTRVLRSDKMENIIFNGTKNRKPLQVAEVSLTFDNNKNILPAEYTTVTITRRYNRSGDSEYLINDVPCRLKDINNLFLDTGIGSDSYAIIELKMVDEILNDKENARRGLFEKAAGIAKFKIRKKEALTRLEDVDKDLNRVEDILHEIDKNLKALERQAKQAERYFELKTEYKTASIAYAKQVVSRQNVTLDVVTLQIESEVDKRNNLLELFNTKEAQIEKEKNDSIVYETSFYDKQKELNEHQAKLRSLENERKLKSERLRFLKDKSTTLNTQIGQDSQSKTEVKKDLENLTIRQNQAANELESIEKILKVLTKEFEEQKQRTGEIQQKSNSNTEILNRKQAYIYQLQKESEIKESQVESLSHDLEKSRLEFERQNDKIGAYEDEMYELSQTYESSKEKLENLQIEEEENIDRIQDLETGLEQIREELQTKRREYDSNRNKYNLTKALVDDMEGFPEAMKFLNKNENWESKAVLLLDTFTCHEKYQQAIEIYLENYKNHYVVDTEEEAYQAIQLLQDNEKGRANFFVLERLKSVTKIDVKVADAKPAIEFVKTEEKYQNLLYSLLKELFVTEDEKTLRQNSNPTLNFITQSGNIIKRKNGLSGGSVTTSEVSHLSRLKKLESLKSEIQQLGEEVNKIQSEFTEKQQLLQTLKQKSLKQAISQAQQKFQEANGEYISLKTKQEQANHLLNTLAIRKEELEQKLDELEDTLRDLLPKKEKEQLDLSNLEEQSANLKEELALESENLSLKSSQFNEHNILFHQQKSKLENIGQEIDYKNESLNSLESRLEKYALEQRQADADVNKLESGLDKEEEVLLALQEQSDTYKLNVEEAEKAYYSIRGRINENEKESKELQRQKDLQDSLIQELTNKMHETKLSLTTMKERLLAEFQLDLEDLVHEIDYEDETRNEHLSEEELRLKVNDYKQKIERLGVINPMAMESYNEMKDRHTFIFTQRNDLFTAKQALMKTIQEMENFAKKAFLESFEAIRKNFILVFRSLFSEEDTADLILTEPDNPLESKIDIIAKPKGKRPLTINQLSGGEKTLTATSLLFAIYLLKPAPFCIFDEVDAPLDDSNTDKFNQIIKNFSKDSQFIIVTHNKRTMSSTDVLYGVTMQEQGVSRVVPVDLRSLD